MGIITHQSTTTDGCESSLSTLRKKFNSIAKIERFISTSTAEHYEKKWEYLREMKQLIDIYHIWKAQKSPKTNTTEGVLFTPTKLYFHSKE
ncbi:hypothetical protein EGR_06612 [Echinococcus granulosus]|uniref:Uncharacterized protein n=1 Tax=Echinococcus granulosus TaxID=6210 RepID=W6UAX6_ECHGR|nr:hypothetical protein EGR_06612 [Echinococcus granulosus]EUB58523.1 hypothetical protein EGR_06612 [Echinococcus granulosus]